MTNKTDHYTTSPSQIVMYSTVWCGDCHRTKLFMEHNNISFLEIDIDEDKLAAEFVMVQNNGNRSVPTIIFPDGTKMVEPSNPELEKKFS